MVGSLKMGVEEGNNRQPENECINVFRLPFMLQTVYFAALNP